MITGFKETTSNSDNGSKSQMEPSGKISFSPSSPNGSLNATNVEALIFERAIFNLNDSKLEDSTVAEDKTSSVFYKMFLFIWVAAIFSEEIIQVCFSSK